jgi:putative ABC transport system substrate-binding protein
MWYSDVRFIVTLILSLLMASPAVDAQPSTKVHRIGRLDAGPPDPSIEAFQQGLHDLGYVEGQNLVIEYRWAEGRADQLPHLAAELVRLNVEVIVARGNLATRAAKQATSTIPIVISTGDPVGEGFVANLAHPGGNITGLSNVAADLDGKRLEFLKETVPNLSRIAVCMQPTVPRHRRAVQDLTVAARALGLELHVLELRSPDEFESAFAAMSQAGAGAILLLPGVVWEPHLRDFTALALKHRLPAIYPWRSDIAGGGLMSYGPSLPDMHRRVAAYVDKILKGAQPADLPVEQPTKFELVINLKTAKALGITIPPSILFQATEVIQ